MHLREGFKIIIVIIIVIIVIIRVEVAVARVSDAYSRQKRQGFINAAFTHLLIDNN